MAWSILATGLGITLSAWVLSGVQLAPINGVNVVSVTLFIGIALELAGALVLSVFWVAAQLQGWGRRRERLPLTFTWLPPEQR